MTTKQKLPQEAYYSVMGFLAPIMIECIDNLQGTNQYRQELKMHLNRALQECEKLKHGDLKKFGRILNVKDKE